MIIDYEYISKSKKLCVSYTEKGKIKLKYYPWANPTKFIICSPDDPERHGKYVTWDGQNVKEIYTSYPNRYSIFYFIDNLPKEEQEMLFKYDEPDIYFIDIENEIKEGGRPQPELADTQIQSISIIHKDKALVIGTEPLSDDQITSIQSDINSYFEKFNPNYSFKYIKFKNEYEMLLNFFNKYVPNMPVMCGWNFKEYDWVFLVNRARKLGIDPTVSSFTGKLIEPFNKTMKKQYFESPSHRVIIDYMELFEKPWANAVKVKESLSLDFASENIIGVKKVNYEGNLKILYETDYKKFVFYNAVDSILVQKIHEKTRYADILYGISILSRVRVLDSLVTIPVTEGILRSKLKDTKNIVLCRDETRVKGDPVKGGWVKEPVMGMARWSVCYDFASLYPTALRQHNISPDSYKGILSADKKYAIFNNHRVEIEPTDSITVNGAVYSAKEGVVTTMMSEIYVERKRYKKEMMKVHEMVEAKKKELKILEDELLLSI